MNSNRGRALSLLRSLGPAITQSQPRLLHGRIDRIDNRGESSILSVLASDSLACASARDPRMVRRVPVPVSRLALLREDDYELRSRTVAFVASVAGLLPPAEATRDKQ